MVHIRKSVSVLYYVIRKNRIILVDPEQAFEKMQTSHRDDNTQTVDRREPSEHAQGQLYTAHSGPRAHW